MYPFKVPTHFPISAIQHHGRQSTPFGRAEILEIFDKEKWMTRLNGRIVIRSFF
jgi:hypothetical protein